MRPTSLRQQLTRAAMLTTFFAILLSAGALLTYELTVYRHAVVADMRAQADLITRSTAAAVEFKDPKVAWENLYLLKQQPRIVAAAVYGPDGALIASHTTQPDAVSARIAINDEFRCVDEAEQSQGSVVAGPGERRDELRVERNAAVAADVDVFVDGRIVDG